MPNSLTGLLPTLVFFIRFKTVAYISDPSSVDFESVADLVIWEKSLYFTFKVTVLPNTLSRRIRRATLVARDKSSFFALSKSMMSL